MRIDLVQEIKQRTDLVELISPHVALRRSGRTYLGLCPFHAEKTPSFVVNPERGFWRCYGCGEGGDCFHFIQKREGLGFNEAATLLARRVGLEWVPRGQTAEQRSQRERLYDVLALAERYYRSCLRSAPQAADYLRRRGLEPETIEKYRLGFAPGGYEALTTHFRRERVSLEDAAAADLVLEGPHGLRDRFVDRIVFPITDVEGRTIAFGGRTMQADGIPRYLNSRESAIFQKGRTLYGLHLARHAIPEAGFTVAVEGYMDLIALHQAGIGNVVATLGTAVTDQHVTLLRRYSNRLVLCYDGDSAGMRAALRGASQFEAQGCEVFVAALPPGADPDTFVRDRGAHAFYGLLHEAEPILDYELRLLRESRNLHDPSQRLAFARDAAAAIARSASHLTRQDAVARLGTVTARLAQEWYPGDPLRARQAEEAVMQEVNRLLRAGRRVRGPAASGPPVAAPASPGPRIKAERFVLQAVLSDARWAELAFPRLEPDLFTDPLLQELAEALQPARAAATFAELEAALARVRDDTERAELVSLLLLDESPISDEAVENCLQALERGQHEARLVELGRRVGEGDTEAMREHAELARRLGGRMRRED